MRQKGRRDSNHRQIVTELRQLGYRVLDLGNVGAGCPDLLVAGWGEGNLSRGGYIQVLVEVKTDKGKLTEDETTFTNDWPGDLWLVARSTEDVLEWFKW